MTQKRKVGPGGGDFALNPNKFVGGAGGGRSGSQITAKPKSSMKTKKGEPVTVVKRKRLAEIAKKAERREDNTRKNKAKIQDPKGKEASKKASREEDKIIEAANNKQRTINSLLAQKHPPKDQRAVDKEIKKLRREKAELVGRAIQSDANQTKSVSGTIKSANKDVSNFNKEINDPRNRSSELESRRREKRNKK